MNAPFYDKLQSLLQMEKEPFTELYSLLQYQEIKRNDFVLKEGEICKFIGLVDNGSLRTFYINENAEEVNFLFHFNQKIEDIVFTDYESFLLSTPSKLNIQALENCSFYLIPHQDWQNLCNKSSYWQMFATKMTEKAYLSAKKRVEDLLYYSPENRYIKLLQSNPQIFQKISQRHLASYLGITPQSLSRIRKRISINYL